jgi:hypothetical protein
MDASCGATGGGGLVVMFLVDRFITGVFPSWCEFVLYFVSTEILCRQDVDVCTRPDSGRHHTFIDCSCVERWWRRSAVVGVATGDKCSCVLSPTSMTYAWVLGRRKK